MQFSDDTPGGPSEELPAIRDYLAGHLRAEGERRSDGSGPLLGDVADEVGELADDDSRLVRLAALWTRPGPGGLDTFVLGGGAARWIRRFDPRDGGTLDQLLDTITANDTAEEAASLDDEEGGR